VEETRLPKAGDECQDLVNTVLKNFRDSLNAEILGPVEILVTSQDGLYSTE
jgi:hypothetical protein